MKTLADELSEVMIREINLRTLKKVQERPTTPILSLDLVNEEIVFDFIESRHAGTFGDFFVYSPESIGLAAQWFVRAIREFYTFLYEPKV